MYSFTPKNRWYKKLISSFILVVFFSSLIVSPAGAQSIPLKAGTVPSIGFQPPVLLGLKVHPENPLLFDFIVDQGQSKLSQGELKSETEKLVKYFLAALTIPDKEVWVNLSPTEKDRIIPDVLGQTVMGKAMLEQDYTLKQLASSLTNPDTELGKKYWEEVGNGRDRSLQDLSKVWIVPSKAEVLESNGIVIVGEKHLKVMMAQEYENSMSSPRKRGSILNNREKMDSRLRGNDMGGGNVSTANQAPGTNHQEPSSEIFRSLILPRIEKEVNEGKNFADVRQIYNSVILAAWYKKALKESLLGKVYADKGKVAGVETDDKQMKQRIYDQYLTAFKKGVYNIIREENDGSGEMIPRKYFSGGALLSVSPDKLTRTAASPQEISRALSVSSGLLVTVQTVESAEPRSTDSGEFNTINQTAQNNGKTSSASIESGLVRARIENVGDALANLERARSMVAFNAIINWARAERGSEQKGAAIRAHVLSALTKIESMKPDFQPGKTDKARHFLFLITYIKDDIKAHDLQNFGMLSLILLVNLPEFSEYFDIFFSSYLEIEQDIVKAEDRSPHVLEEAISLFRFFPSAHQKLVEAAAQLLTDEDKARFIASISGVGRKRLAIKNFDSLHSIAVDDMRFVYADIFNALRDFMIQTTMERLRNLPINEDLTSAQKLLSPFRLQPRGPALSRIKDLNAQQQTEAFEAMADRLFGGLNIKANGPADETKLRMIFRDLFAELALFALDARHYSLHQIMNESLLDNRTLDFMAGSHFKEITDAKQRRQALTDALSRIGFDRYGVPEESLQNHLKGPLEQIASSAASSSSILTIPDSVDIPSFNDPHRKTARTKSGQFVGKLFFRVLGLDSQIDYAVWIEDNQFKVQKGSLTIKKQLLGEEKEFTPEGNIEPHNFPDNGQLDVILGRKGELIFTVIALPEASNAVSKQHLKLKITKTDNPEVHAFDLEVLKTNQTLFYWDAPLFEQKVKEIVSPINEATVTQETRPTSFYKKVEIGHGSGKNQIEGRFAQSIEIIISRLVPVRLFYKDSLIRVQPADDPTKQVPGLNGQTFPLAKGPDGPFIYLGLLKGTEVTFDQSLANMRIAIYREGKNFKFNASIINDAYADIIWFQVPAASSSLKKDSEENNNPLGGIDFDPTNMNLQIKRDGRGVPLPLPQQNIEQINIQGLTPVIINIVPIDKQNLPLLLGQAPKEPAKEPELTLKTAG